jgi:Rrf2 family protein
MRLTTKGRFAVTAMIDLALRQSSGPVTLAAISQRQQISLSYLEQLFGKLRRHDLVESTRGPGGGYTLGRKPSEITVADIIVSVDEPIDATQCGGKENCLGEGTRCMTSTPRWWISLTPSPCRSWWTTSWPRAWWWKMRPPSSVPFRRRRWSSPFASTPPIRSSRWARRPPSNSVLLPEP